MSRSALFLIETQTHVDQPSARTKYREKKRNKIGKNDERMSESEEPNSGLMEWMPKVER